MVLKPSLRNRTTFVHCDSSRTIKTDVATSEFYSHVLLKFPDVELKAVLDHVARHRQAQSVRSFYRSVAVRRQIQSVRNFTVTSW